MKAIVLVGPTAVGKTGLSLDLAEDDFEIVSSDSVQVYKYLNIGSGKTDFFERKGINHHLIDIVEPDFFFSAGDFCRYVIISIEEIKERDNIPFFVGGTGLYIDSFFKGIANIPEIAEGVREQLTVDLELNGLSDLYNELVKVDKAFAEKVHPNDKQRIIRGLEVFRSTGKPISSYYSTNKGHESEKTLFIGLYEDRDILKKRIDKRVDFMINEGLINEVKELRKMGYGPELKSMKSIGYKEINNYLDGLIDLHDAIEMIKSETKAYAKRQMTWFRKNKKINWFETIEYKKIFELINKWKVL